MKPLCVSPPVSSVLTDSGLTDCQPVPFHSSQPAFTFCPGCGLSKGMRSSGNAVSMYIRTFLFPLARVKANRTRCSAGAGSRKGCISPSPTACGSCSDHPVMRLSRMAESFQPALARYDSSTSASNGSEGSCGISMSSFFLQRLLCVITSMKRLR